jgi:transposase-like protein
MSEEDGVLVRRRGRAEIERLVDLYCVSGMGRKEFCRSHGLGLSTLNRHLKNQHKRQRASGEDESKPHRLVAVEVATVSPATEIKPAAVLTVLLSNRRRVEVQRGFDEETLAQLVTMLERL